MVENPNWYLCDNESDAIKVLDVCGYAKAINAKYADEFAAYSAFIRPTTICEWITKEQHEWNERTVVACVSGRCTLVDPLQKITG
jgi:hypothetical protein